MNPNVKNLVVFLDYNERTLKSFFEIEKTVFLKPKKVFP